MEIHISRAQSRSNSCGICGGRRKGNVLEIEERQNKKYMHRRTEYKTERKGNGKEKKGRKELNK
jgi:hypothetical protein